MTYDVAPTDPRYLVTYGRLAHASPDEISESFPTAAESTLNECGFLHEQSIVAVFLGLLSGRIEPFTYVNLF